MIGYLDALAEGAEREGKPVVVVLDRAPLHTAGAVGDARAGWEAKGLCALATCLRTART